MSYTKKIIFFAGALLTMCAIALQSSAQKKTTFCSRKARG